GAGPLVGEPGVGPRQDGGNVARDPLGGGEVVGHRAGDVAVVGGVLPRGVPVGRREPLRGRDHGEVVDGLEVRLLEHGEHPAAIGGLVLGVKVNGVVLGVHIAVHALPGTGVQRATHHVQLIGRAQLRQPDPRALHDVVHVQRLAVELHGAHGVVDEVDERLRAGLRGEAHRDLGTE
ncbi:hypothetical protein PCS70012_02356, partial [Streptococcus pneumoniae PCS70012]